MIGADLLKHAREFARYVRNYKYEQTDEGIYFPSAKALVRGAYTHWVTGLESEMATDHNLLPNEGLEHILDVVMLGSSPVTDWYTALYANAYTPTSALTAANFTTTAGEITSGSEGYSEATRVLWSGDAVSGADQSVTNDATPAAFTIVTASTLSVEGAALLSASGKGATTGTLISAGRFASTRTLSNGDTFNLKYKVDADAV